MAQRGRRTRPDIRSVALGLAKGGLQPAEIERLLHGTYGPEAPERRTIQSIVSEARQSPDDPWTLDATDADDAALVLPVLRVLLERMEAEGKRFRLTVPQAERIAWLRRAVPDIPLREAGRLALMSTMPPASYLAWAPWRSEADASAYSDAAGRGHRHVFPQRVVRTPGQLRHTDAGVARADGGRPDGHGHAEAPFSEFEGGPAMKRRGNNEGGEPRRRKDGRWQADYSGADGRRHSVIAPTVTECRSRLRAAVRQADDGQAPADGRLTVGAWLDVWMRDHVRGGTKPRRPRTADGYETIIELHLKPYIGRRPVARLTAEDVAGCLASVANEPNAGATTVRHTYAVLHTAMARAVRSRKVATNVVDLVDKPTATYREIDPWTPAEIDLFLDAVAGDRNGPLYAFAIGTGLRQGELLGLRWPDVDLEARVLRVSAQLDRRRQLADVKTERGRRTFGLPELALYALRAQKASTGTRTHRGRQLVARRGLRFHDEGRTTDAVAQPRRGVRSGARARRRPAPAVPRHAARVRDTPARCRRGDRGHLEDARPRRLLDDSRRVLAPVDGSIAGRGGSDRWPAQAPPAQGRDRVMTQSAGLVRPVPRRTTVDDLHLRPPVWPASRGSLAGTGRAGQGRQADRRRR